MLFHNYKKATNSTQKRKKKKVSIQIKEKT